jgi:hypothetical protein
MRTVEWCARDDRVGESREIEVGAASSGRTASGRAGARRGREEEKRREAGAGESIDVGKHHGRSGFGRRERRSELN